jgi:hypothetical protein
LYGAKTGSLRSAAQTEIALFWTENTVRRHNRALRGFALEERVREGLMLQEDADRFIAAAWQKNPLDASVRLGPLIQAGAYSGR